MSVSIAYMLRQDGKAFSVPVHVYAAKDDVEETLNAGEWLYKNTENESTRQTVIKFIASWAADYTDGADAEAIIEYVKDAGYPILSVGFVKEHQEEIESAEWGDTEELNLKVFNLLNEEFCRVRYGGSLDTSIIRLGDVYFRISSSGYNWFDTIWNYVYKNQKSITSVTIVKDEESTGVKDFVYTIGGEKIWLMSTERFLVAEGNPIVEKFEK